VYVDDVSRDGSAAILAEQKRLVPELRVIRHRAQSGQSTAIRNGVKAARGRWIATLDGDGQNNPAFLPNLVSAIENGGNRVGLAAGPVVSRLGDVYGSTVNIASRLTSLCRPGWALVDRVMAESLRDDPRFVLRPRRPESVRGFHHLRQWRLRRADEARPGTTRGERSGHGARLRGRVEGTLDRASEKSHHRTT